MKQNVIRRAHLFIVLILLIGIHTPNSFGQELVLPDSFPIFRITENNQPDDGYLFMFARPQKTKSPGWLVIMDNYGTPVFYRYLPHKSGNFTLHSNGYLSYRDRVNDNAMFYIMDSSFVTVDSVTMDDYPIDGHDFRILENGNYLMFALDTRSIDMSAIIEGGDPNASVSGVVIREVDTDNNTVFEWNSWDHIGITESYAALTSSSISLLHPNSMDIDEDGNILLIGRTLDAVIKINRQNGEIIYRLGGKMNEFSFSDSSQMFSRPHDFRSLGNGHYTIFDNGTNRDPSYSRAVEYLLDTAAKTIDLIWEFDARKKVFARSGGSARRLPSGNTVLCYGGQMNAPSITEVHPDGSKAFELYPVDVSAGRGLKFPWKTSLFEPGTSSVNFSVWDGYTDNAKYPLTITNRANHPIQLSGYSLMTDAFSIKEDFPLEIPAGGDTILTVVYYPAWIETGYVADKLTINSDINSDTLVQRISIQVDLKGWLEDTDPPGISIPIDRVINVSRDTLLFIEFTEPVRMLGGRTLNYANVDSLIVLKKDGKNGEDVAFNAVINSGLDKITIQTDSVLDESQLYYLAISGQVEDYSGNQASPNSAFFSTGDTINTSLLNKEAKNIHVYPNPGMGLYHISMPFEGRYDLTVFSIDGRLILHEQNLEGKSSLNLREMPGKFYILRVTDRTTSELYIRKLIKL
ncbi:aryl-sulfate sulfotransferase [Bacteroidota bacterium]